MPTNCSREYLEVQSQASHIKIRFDGSGSPCTPPKHPNLFSVIHMNSRKFTEALLASRARQSGKLPESPIFRKEQFVKNPDSDGNSWWLCKGKRKNRNGQVRNYSSRSLNWACNKQNQDNQLLILKELLMPRIQPVNAQTASPSTTALLGEVKSKMGVALNILTNYFNHVAGTEIDFPPAPALAVV